MADIDTFRGMCTCLTVLSHLPSRLLVLSNRMLLLIGNSGGPLMVIGTNKAVGIVRSGMTLSWLADGEGSALDLDDVLRKSI